MAFNITTTSGTVILDDLGARTFTHPTVSYDLLTEYSTVEINQSLDLQSAIDIGSITVDDGNGNSITSIHTSNSMQKPTYDPNDVEKNIFDVDNHIDGTANKVYTASEKSNLNLNTNHRTTISGNPHNLNHNNLNSIQGGEIDEYYHLTYAQYISSSGDPERTITVAQSNAQHTSIVDALTVASGLSPTESNPISINVSPGKYIEPPFSMIPYVSVIGTGGPLSTIIETNNESSHFITGSHLSMFKDVQINGPTGSGYATVYHTDEFWAPMFFWNCLIGSRGYCGIWVDGQTTSPSPTDAPAIVHMFYVGNRYIAPYLQEQFVRVTGNSYAVALNSAVMNGPPGTVQTGWHAYGQNARLRTYMCIYDMQGNGIDDSAIFADAGAHVVADACSLNGATIGIHIGPTSGGTEVSAVGTTLREELTENARKESVDSMLRISGSGDKDKFPTLNGVENVSIDILDGTEGEAGKVLLGNLSVGSENIPKESSFGGGNSHTRGMKVFTNTNLEVGTWGDITTALSSISGSTVLLFPGTGIGNTLYVGGDIEFPGVKHSITAGVVGGSMIHEYWNGSSWIVFNEMTSDSDFPYSQYGTSHMKQLGSKQVRFQDMPGWATKNLNGLNKYWIRFRISSSITTIPIGEQFKLHTHRTEINKDGFVEYFGNARQVRDLLWHQRLVDDLAGSSPANVSIQLANNITITPIDNRFIDGTTDGVGGIINVPDGLDTSKPIKLQIGWRPSTNNIGDIEFETRHAIVAEGSSVDGSISSTLQSTIVSVNNQQDIFISTIIEFNINSAIPGNLFALSIFRNATSGNLDDTFSGNVEIFYMRVTGTFWR